MKFSKVELRDLISKLFSAAVNYRSFGHFLALNGLILAGMQFLILPVGCGRIWNLLHQLLGTPSYLMDTLHRFADFLASRTWAAASSCKLSAAWRFSTGRCLAIRGPWTPRKWRTPGALQCVQVDLALVELQPAKIPKVPPGS